MINFFLVTTISFLGVDSIYSIVTAQLDTFDLPKPIISKTSFSPVEIKPPPRSHYSVIVERDIFHTHTANSVAKVEKIIIEDIKPTERNLKLWGTVVGNGPASAYAIIEEPGARSRRSRQYLHKTGDVVQGATIKKIMREKVILSAKGKNEILHLVDRKSGGKSIRNRQIHNQQRNKPIRRYRRTIRRSLLEKHASNINELMSQANIRPHSEGFQITRIRPSSFFRRLGLRNGDIITTVGGRAVTTANDALDIWRDLTAGRETSLEIIRRGRLRTIDFSIR